MPAPLVADWSQVQATAVSTGSLKAASDAHGISYAAVRMRASRENWPIGTEVKARRERHFQVAIKAGSTAQAIVSQPVSTVTAAVAIDEQLQQHGRETRVMLAQALLHASGQARRTKHPLDRARQIKDVAAAAAQVHGWSGDAAASIIMPIQINITRE